MTINLRDPKALHAVSPLALSAYAQSAGWSRTESFGGNSDVYTNPQLPEIIIPRTQNLGDYIQVVTQLIKIFAEVAEVDETALYNDLVLADRDVTRVTVNDEFDDGTIDLVRGLGLIRGSRGLLLAVAHSLLEPRAVYHTGSNREANELLRGIRIGQTERGSYVVTLLSPVILPHEQEPSLADIDADNKLVELQVIPRLVQVLSATHNATERTITGDLEPFAEAVSEGINANFCEALARLIAPFNSLSVSTTWARTRPVLVSKQTVRFERGNSPILREAAKSLRKSEVREDVRLRGSVQSLDRDYTETHGTIILRASIDDREQSVKMVLDEPDYNHASQANTDKFPIMVEGDLLKLGQQWRLLNPRLTEVVSDKDDEYWVRGIRA